MKQPFGRGCPVVYHSVLLYFILSMAVVAKCILLEFAPIMPAFCSLLLPSYFSKNYAGKIGASLVAFSAPVYTVCVCVYVCVCVVCTLSTNTIFTRAYIKKPPVSQL